MSLRIEKLTIINGKPAIVNRRYSIRQKKIKIKERKAKEQAEKDELLKEKDDLLKELEFSKLTQKKLGKSLYRVINIVKFLKKEYNIDTFENMDKTSK